MTKPIGCVCNHESGVQCMLHADLDAYIIREALSRPDIEPEHNRDDDDPSTHEIDCTCIFCIPGV